MQIKSVFSDLDLFSDHFSKESKSETESVGVSETKRESNKNIRWIANLCENKNLFVFWTVRMQREMNKQMVAKTNEMWQYYTTSRCRCFRVEKGCNMIPLIFDRKLFLPSPIQPLNTPNQIANCSMANLLLGRIEHDACMQICKQNTQSNA